MPTDPKMNRPSLLTAALLAACLASPAGALLRAQPEPGFPEAVFIEPLPDGQSFGDCSGVVLSPTVVLSAAHCLSGKDFGVPKTLAARVSVYDGADHLARRDEAAAFLRSPSYRFALAADNSDRCECLAAATAADDWGLLFLDRPLDVAPVRRIDELLPPELRMRIKATPVRVFTSPTFQGDTSLGRDLQDWLKATFYSSGRLDAVVVGFGFGTCANEATARDCAGKGVKRSAAVRVGGDPRCGRAAAPDANQLPVAVLCITAVAEGHVPITFADSGGPVYFRSKDGEWLLAGIVSINTAAGFSGSNAQLAVSILAVIDDLLPALDAGSPRRETLPFPAP